MSRRRAKKTLKEGEVRQQLLAHGVDVTGSGLDEAPAVYKDIHKVMEAQKDLVEVLGIFTPKIVRMCGDRRFVEAD
jgi:tRNA-splicing ligase RtcB